MYPKYSFHRARRHLHCLCSHRTRRHVSCFCSQLARYIRHFHCLCGHWARYIWQFIAFEITGKGIYCTCIVLWSPGWIYLTLVLPLRSSTRYLWHLYCLCGHQARQNLYCLCGHRDRRHLYCRCGHRVRRHLYWLCSHQARRPLYLRWLTTLVLTSRAKVYIALVLPLQSAG